MKTKILEIYGMYVGQSQPYNILEDNHYKVKRITAYTWELYELTLYKGVEVYIGSYGHKDLYKLLDKVGEKSL